MPSAESIRVENLTGMTLFVRFTIIADNLRLEIFPDYQDGSFGIFPGRFVSTGVTPEIRACYSGSILSYEFIHHVPGGLEVQYPQQGEQLSDGRYAAVFRLRTPTN